MKSKNIIEVLECLRQQLNIFGNVNCQKGCEMKQREFCKKSLDITVAKIDTLNKYEERENLK